MAQEGLHITFSSQAGSCDHGSKASRNRRQAESVAAAGRATPVRALKVSLLPHIEKSGSTAGLRGSDTGHMFRATTQTKKCLFISSWAVKK